MAKLVVVADGRYHTDGGRLEPPYDVIHLNVQDPSDHTLAYVQEVSGRVCALYLAYPTIDLVCRIARGGVFGPATPAHILAMVKPREFEGPNLTGFLSPELYKHLIVRFPGSPFEIRDVEASFAAVYTPRVKTGLYEQMFNAALQWGIFRMITRTKFEAPEWAVDSLEDAIIDFQARLHGAD